MKLEKLLPKYSWVPLISVVLANFAVYHITMFAVDDSRRHYIHMAADEAIPFVPFFVVFYVLSFAQWGLSWLLTARESRSVCNLYCKADLFAKLICLIVFLLYPTAIERPSLVVNDLFSWCMSVVWTFDRPVNCLPSIHIVASYIALRASFGIRKAGDWYRLMNAVLFAGCAAAVVFTKQHYLVDIPAGMLAAEIGLIVAKRTDNERFLWVR